MLVVKLLHKGSVYKQADTPWVQKLQEGVSPETRVYHRHLLNSLNTTIRELGELAKKYEGIVFEPEDFEKLVEARRVLERYNFPLALVEVVSEDEPLILE